MTDLITADEAIETVLAMAMVQDGYAKKAADPGLKLIHKANAKAQRQVAAAITRLSDGLAQARAACSALLEGKDAMENCWKDARADAQAAQAMVVAELRQFVTDSYQCGCMDAGCAGRHAERNSTLEALSETLDALAPADGLALVRELRAERDALKKKLISPDPYEDTAHPDDHAVNRFAAVMKGKLAAKRLQGRGGWQEPEVPNGYLSRMLREHVDKGDPVDVANLAMMIHQRGERIAPQNEGASCKAIDDAIAERDTLAAANAVLEARVAGLRDKLSGLEKAASEVSRRGAETGPQWSKLTSAILFARAALASAPAQNGGDAT